MSSNNTNPLHIDTPNQADRTEPVLGWHWFADFIDCEALPSTPDALNSLLVKAAQLSGATIVQSCFHQFAPFGLSGVVVIAESHVAAHTWPEHRTMCVDFFSCSQKIHVDLAMEYIRDVVRSKKMRIRHEVRGGS